MADVFSPQQPAGGPPHGTSRAHTATVGFLFGLAEVRELPGSFIIKALQALGLTTAGARSYITRALKEGRLTSRRRGRISYYAMAGDYLERFDAIEHRFAVEPVWEGSFHAVIYDLPESRRSERDNLRSAAFAQGWGCPRPGLLIGMEPPGLWAQDGWRARLVMDLTTARHLAAASWDLDDVATRVAQTVAHLRTNMERPDSGDPSPSRSRAVSAPTWGPLIRAHDLLSDAIYLWGLMPPLPGELLPDGFPTTDLTWLSAQMSGPLMLDGVSAARTLLAAELGGQ